MNKDGKCYFSVDCRTWQVKGVPCVHEASLIALIRNARWEDYVDSYFTMTRLRTTYSNVITPMPSKGKEMKYELGTITK